MTVVLAPLGAAIALAISIVLVVSGAFAVVFSGRERLVTALGLGLAVAGGSLIVALCAGVA